MTKSKVKTLTISEPDLKDFYIPENRRQIRNGLVHEIKQALDSGETYGGAIAVNKRGDKYRILDGQHRFTAIKEFIEDSEGAEEVKGHFIIYNDLSDVEETEQYDILQRRASETLNDYIKMHKKEMPVLRKIEKNFPIPVSYNTTKDSISFNCLLRVWTTKNTTQPSIVGRRGFVELVNNTIKDTDYFQAVAFFTKFKQVFGLPAKANPYYKFSALWSLTTIYWANNGVMPEGKIWELFRTRALGDAYLMQMAKYYSSDAATDLRRYLLNKFNQGNRGNQFL